MPILKWNIEELCGYTPITTFYADFTIAEAFGKDAIQDTFNRVFEEWKTNYKYLTEIVMVLSWKSFECANNIEFAKLYSRLYYIADEYACKNLKDEELEYYYETTD